MAKVDTHGLKMVGLKNAVGYTMHCYYFMDSTYIVYDPDNGRVYEYYSMPDGVHARDCYVISVREHVTMQELADMIYEVIENHEEHQI